MVSKFTILLCGINLFFVQAEVIHIDTSYDICDDSSYCAGIRPPNDKTIHSGEDPLSRLVLSNKAPEDQPCYCWKGKSAADHEECSNTEECELNTHCVNKPQNDGSVQPVCAYQEIKCRQFWEMKRDKDTKLPYCIPTAHLCKEGAAVPQFKAIVPASNIIKEFDNQCEYHKANRQIYLANPDTPEFNYWERFIQQ